MSVTPYIGEIMLFAGAYAPDGWMFCEGQTLSILDRDYLALFSLIGTTYGGSTGERTFKLPDLRGRAIINQGLISDRQIGDIGGTATQTVPLSAMPRHTHNIQTILGQLGDSASPAGRKLGAYKKNGQENYPYSIKETTSQPMSPSAIGAAGGGQPLNNLPPFLTMRYAIAVKGEFPIRV